MKGGEFTALNAFVAVAERRNFARAAAHLGVTPPTISQTIRALEQRLGLRLLNRTTRSVSLTDAGERLLARIRPAITEIGAAVEEVKELRDTLTGTLRLNVSSVAAEIVLAPVTRAFLAAYPAITLDVTVDDGVSETAGGRFDAGIRVGRRVARDMQIARVSAPSRVIAIASAEYLKHHSTPRVPQDLQQHNCIRLRNANQLIVWEFARGRNRIEMSVNGTLIVNRMELMVRAVLDGIGIGYTLESHVAAHIAHGRVVPLLTDWSGGVHSYYLYYSGRRHLPAPLKVFLAFLRAHLARA
ncbi:MAG TPA: LysR substrate-binding domain-containing protein [Steroidobacteraceae bacterium]|jgi:DNA-binding transcriptional LysR family regulator|nr:LysR substrate-binding domain-containing protein [Steroidobacteraceae bacterium]